MHKYLKQIIERDGHCAIFSGMQCAACPVRVECGDIRDSEVEGAEFFEKKLEMVKKHVRDEIKKAIDA
jgi:hypothetical protein